MSYFRCLVVERFGFGCELFNWYSYHSNAKTLNIQYYLSYFHPFWNHLKIRWTNDPQCFGIHWYDWCQLVVFLFYFWELTSFSQVFWIACQTYGFDWAHVYSSEFIVQSFSLFSLNFTYHKSLQLWNPSFLSNHPYFQFSFLELQLCH